MSTKDSAGDKLVASIRKTRNSTVDRAASEKPAVAKKRTVSRKHAVPAKKKTATRKKTVPGNRQQKQQLVDLFQSGRRVWPD